MKVNIKDLLPSVPEASILNKNHLPQGHFRFSLSEFLYTWNGFPNLNYIEKRDRLERIFNTDYFDAPIVVTDATSLQKLKETPFSASSPGDSSGFIYIYTFEDNILAGKHSKGWLWWTYERFDAKLKVGCTGRHIFNRVEEQNAKICNPDPPILLAALWTNLVKQCEHEIHFSLRSKRVTDKQGREAKGGVEWFKDTPEGILPVVFETVNKFRFPSAELNSINTHSMS